MFYEETQKFSVRNNKEKSDYQHSFEDASLYYIHPFL